MSSGLYKTSGLLLLSYDKEIFRLDQQNFRLSVLLGIGICFSCFTSTLATSLVTSRENTASKEREFRLS